MCRAVRCRTCGKTTWAGCGAHVDQVLRGVPDEQRCRCAETSQSEAPRTRAEDGGEGGGFWARLFKKSP